MSYTKLCKDCEFFKIMDYPEKGVDFGHAVCGKHYLITEFFNMRKFNHLYCIEKDEGNDNDNHASTI